MHEIVLEQSVCECIRERMFCFCMKVCGSSVCGCVCVMRNMYEQLCFFAWHRIERFVCVCVYIYMCVCVCVCVYVCVYMYMYIYI